MPQLAALDPPTAARRGFITKLENQVDPDRVLDPDERARRVEQARREHLATAGRRSGEARRAKRGQRAVDSLIIDALIEKLVAQAPALSDGQRARLETLLSPTAH